MAHQANGTWIRLQGVRAGLQVEQVQRKVHAVAARGVVGRRVRVHATAPAQHMPQQAPPLLGLNAFIGAQERVRPAPTESLARGNGQMDTGHSPA